LEKRGTEVTGEKKKASPTASKASYCAGKGKRKNHFPRVKKKKKEDLVLNDLGKKGGPVTGRENTLFLKKEKKKKESPAAGKKGGGMKTKKGKTEFRGPQTKRRNKGGEGQRQTRRKGIEEGGGKGFKEKKKIVPHNGKRRGKGRETVGREEAGQLFRKKKKGFSKG